MSTSDPEFYASNKIPAKSDEVPPRQRGCFFYGCLISGILALLLLIAVGIGAYVLYRAFTDFVEQNTATAPRALPKVEVPPETRLAVKEKFEEFEKPVASQEPDQTLILTADEINALIDGNPHLKGQIYLTIEDDRVKAKLSLALDPLSKVLERLRIEALRGRYFNGEVAFKGSFRDRTLKLMIESLEVNGRPLPEPFVTQLNDVLIEVSKDPQHADKMDKVDSIEVKDGKVIIKKRIRNKEPGPEAVTPPPVEPAGGP